MEDGEGGDAPAWEGGGGNTGLLDSGGGDDGDAVAVDEAGCEGPYEALLHRAALDPPHVEGSLVGDGVEVEQLEGDGRGELLGRLEEANEERRLDEVVD